MNQLFRDYNNQTFARTPIDGEGTTVYLWYGRSRVQVMLALIVAIYGACALVNIHFTRGLRLMQT